MGSLPYTPHILHPISSTSPTPCGSLISTLADTAPSQTSISFLPTHHKSLFSHHLTSSPSTPTNPSPTTTAKGIFPKNSSDDETTAQLNNLLWLPWPSETNTSFLAVMLSLPVMDVCCLVFQHAFFLLLVTPLLVFLGKGEESLISPWESLWLGAALSPSRRLRDPG